MKRTGYGLGIVLLLLAAASALAAIVMATRDTPGASSLGWPWFQIHGNSLVGFQVLIEKGVSPALWPPIQSLLTWPLWLVLGVRGALLGLFCLGLRGPARPGVEAARPMRTDRSDQLDLEPRRLERGKRIGARTSSRMALPADEAQVE